MSSKLNELEQRRLIILAPLLEWGVNWLRKERPDINPRDTREVVIVTPGTWDRHLRGMRGPADVLQFEAFDVVPELFHYLRNIIQYRDWVTIP